MNPWVQYTISAKLCPRLSACQSLSALGICLTLALSALSLASRRVEDIIP